MKLPTLRERWNQLQAKRKLGSNALSVFDLEILYDKFMNFTGITPQLSDFVPCNKEGDPLNEPKEWVSNIKAEKEEFDEYQKALDAVKFKGYSYQVKMFGKSKSETVRDSHDKAISIKLTLDDGEVVENWDWRNGYNCKTYEDLITSGIALEPVDSLIKELKL